MPLARPHCASTQHLLGVALRLPVSQNMLVSGVIERRIAEIFLGENTADQNERRPGELLGANLCGDSGERCVDDLLIRPSDAVENDDGTIRTIMRSESALDVAEVPNREVDGQSR